MFIQFNKKLFNLSALMVIERVKSQEEFPKYGIQATGGMGAVLGTEWYDSIQKREVRFRQIQTGLGAEDVWVGGGNLNSGSCDD